MRFTKIQLRNFKSHDDTTIQFDTMRVVALTGRNGRGKTSILDGIVFALFGADALDAAKRQDSLIREGEKEMLVTLEFDHRGERFRIRRGRKRGGRPTLHLDRWSDASDGNASDEWQSLTLATTKDTQQRLADLLGVTMDTLLRSTFVRQGDSARFSAASPAERKDTLVQALDLAQYSPWADAARERHRTNSAAVAQAQAKMVEVQQRIDQHDAGALERATHDAANAAALLEQERAKLEAADKELADARVAAAAGEQARQLANDKAAAATQARTHATQLAGDATRATQELVAARAAIAGRDELAKDQPAIVDVDQLEQAGTAASAALEAAQAKARERAELVREHATAIAARTRADEAHQAAVTKRDQAQAALDAFAQQEAPCCPTCEQEVKGEAHERARAKLQDQLAAFGADADQLERAANDARDAALTIAERIPEIDPAPPEVLERLQADVTKAREAYRNAAANNQRHHEIATKLAGIDETAKRIPQLEQAATEAAQRQAEAEQRATALEAEATAAKANAESPATERIAQLEAAAGQQRTIVANAEQASRQATEAETRARAAQEAAQRDARALDDARAAFTTAVAAEARTAALADAFGRDGVPKMMLRMIRPQLEQDTNDQLRRFNAPYQARIDLERLTADGRLADALDITIIAGNGERPYEALSGGEKYRTNTALRMAIGKVLAQRGGAQLRSLVLDEPEGLDDEGFAALADIVRGASDEFDLVLTVTHGDGLAAACDTVLRVTGVQDGHPASRVEVLA